MIGERRLGSTRRGPASPLPPAVARIPARGLVVALAVAILVGAVVVRFAALSTQPGGLYPDEGAEALDAHRLLHLPGFHPVFFQDDGGREAFYAYLVAFSFRLLGESTTVLRGVSAALGLTVDPG